MNQKHPGGRPPGVKGRRLNGLSKRCLCGRRNWPTCRHSWYGTFRHARVSLDRHFDTDIHSKTEALEYYERLRMEVRSGAFSPGRHKQPQQPVAQRPTLRDVLMLYCDDFGNDPSRRRHRWLAVKQMADLICRTRISTGPGVTIPFGDLPIEDIRTQHVEAFRDGRRALLRQREEERVERAARRARGESTASLPPSSPEVPRNRGGEVGVTRALELVRRVFNWAIAKEIFPHENPFHRFGKRVIKFARQQPRTRRLQPGEEERLLAAADVHLRHLIIAALDTACRRGELLSLQWKHVAFNEDGEPRAFMLPAGITKTNCSRSVPTSPRLRAILHVRRLDPDGKEHGPDAYVFGNAFGERIADVKLAWKGACQRAGIEGLRLHDLRREAASRLLFGGVDLLTVSQLLGHQRATTTDTYLRGRDDLLEQRLREFHESQTLAVQQRD